VAPIPGIKALPGLRSIVSSLFDTRASMAAAFLGSRSLREIMIRYIRVAQPEKPEDPLTGFGALNWRDPGERSIRHATENRITLDRVDDDGNFVERVSDETVTGLEGLPPDDPPDWRVYLFPPTDPGSGYRYTLTASNGASRAMVVPPDLTISDSWGRASYTVPNPPVVRPKNPGGGGG
jgi:hypothetical protein